MDEEIDVSGGGESPDYQAGWRDGAAHAEGKGADLLAALKLAVAQLDAHKFESMRDAFDAARTAIAKAEGKGAS